MTQLQAENYQIKDRAKLVEKMAKMPDGDRDLYVAEIRENYQRLPAAGSFVPVAHGAAPAVPLDQEFDEDAFDRAVAYQREHECSWEEAEEAIKKAGAK